MNRVLKHVRAQKKPTVSARGAGQYDSKEEAKLDLGDSMRGWASKKKKAKSKIQVPISSIIKLNEFLSEVYLTVVSDGLKRAESRRYV